MGGKRNEHHRRNWFMLAGADFDTADVLKLDIIPPIRRHGQLVEPAGKAGADLLVDVS
jgi:hypothetical protein